MKAEKRVKTKIYLTNKELLAELKRCHENNKMSNELARMLQLLTDRYVSAPNLAGYPEDMKQYAMYMLVRTWKSFNPELGQNPFAFFTQCIKNSCYQYLNREKRQRQIRDRYMVMSGLNPSYSSQIEHEDNLRANREMGDFEDEFYMDNQLTSVVDPDVDVSSSEPSDSLFSPDISSDVDEPLTDDFTDIPDDDDVV